MAHKAINTLFTSVGRRVELVQAFRRAYEALNLAGNIVVLDIDPLAPALQVADRSYMTPRYTSPDYIPTVIEICRHEAIGLIFPLIDPDIPILSQSQSEIETTGAKVIVSPSDAVAKTADKWHTTQFFRSLNIPTPRSWLPQQLNTAQLEYPLFIKPRQGSAAMHTHKIHNRRELDFYLDGVPDPIIQECLPGPEITNDVVCSLNGRLLGIVSRKRIEVRWGEVAKGVTIYNQDIMDACAKIASALPTIGPITVQCMMKEGIPYFTEINARLGGGVPLGIAAGLDTPRWMLAQAVGLPVDVPPLGSYQTGIYLTRCDQSFFLTEDERAQFASNTL
ncbi:MAG: ATP-grasp domain-containing protein [Chloroflexi bacterium]|nr:ATP-grasp domain-containing protein [Chloroflexota bacterium]